MEKYLDILKKVPLFKDIEANDINSLLTCLSAKTKYFKANETVFLAAKQNSGIVLPDRAGCERGFLREPKHNCVCRKGPAGEALFALI